MLSFGPRPVKLVQALTSSSVKRPNNQPTPTTRLKCAQPVTLDLNVIYCQKRGVVYVGVSGGILQAVSESRVCKG